MDAKHHLRPSLVVACSVRYHLGSARRVVAGLIFAEWIRTLASGSDASSSIGAEGVMLLSFNIPFFKYLLSAAF